ncbi:MAG: glutathione S-transferase [Solirubrobacterales bacterium]|nr:glutathione S-transferase [Solirubrobacterales bacterium]
MPAKLYVVHGSHPCDTVAKALELKGIAYKRIELPPPSHALVMRPLFGGRTVPGIRFEDGTKVQGSRAILRELERRVPEPPLYGGPEVDEAERWGDEVLQPVARRLLWPSFQRHPEAMHAYQEGQRGPKLPLPVIKAAAPVITRVERRMNAATDAAARADLQALPGLLDKIDAWIAAGVLGGAQPNAADLQIAPTLRLLHTIGDVRPLIAGRPAEELAFRYFDRLPGETPAGLFPAEWLPAQPAVTA